jgi:hypothetical protein
VSADERDILQDILLHFGNAGGEEDDGKQGDTAESTSFEATLFCIVSIAPL